MNTVEFTGSEFYNFIAEHKLMGSHCQQCGDLYLPPRPRCPQCHQEEMKWVEFSGTGKLVAFTVVHVAPTAMLTAGYSFTKPYCTGIVEFENGARISAQILGVDVERPETIEIGIALQVKFIQRSNGEGETTALAFEPVG
ncbi:MAG: Zn-ribbon domain-containing OB-fold protein [Chloroflexota bacterium]|nr:Zn-ribbon domain-containing OB-fold protein [Chloroflexota bacterium]